MLAIFAILTVVRQTRAEEDAQRAEMLASGVVGRYAMLAAAMAVVVGTIVIAGLLMVAVLIGYGADAVGSVAFAGAAAAYGVVFAAVAAVTVQLGSYSRAANGMALAALGMAFVLRGWGDATNHPWASWLSPMGWVSQVEPSPATAGRSSCSSPVCSSFWSALQRCLFGVETWARA